MQNNSVSNGGGIFVYVCALHYAALSHEHRQESRLWRCTIGTILSLVRLCIFCGGFDRLAGLCESKAIDAARARARYIRCLWECWALTAVSVHCPQNGLLNNSLYPSNSIGVDVFTFRHSDWMCSRYAWLGIPSEIPYTAYSNVQTI